MTTHKKTPLYDQHLALDARITRFAGFDMPLQYSSIVEEHMAVRQAAGLFDVSHMGEVFVQGPEAFAFVQQLVTNDISRLRDGRALYTVMCRPDGGIIDDLLVYQLRSDTYMLVINASNIEKDVAWMQENNPMGALLHNTSDYIAMMALQGPNAIAIAQKITELPLSELQYYHFYRPAPGSFMGCDKSIISCTGYTGEAGIEIYCEAERATAIWNALLEAGKDMGLKPCGLAARDTLRLEAGFCLYGNDITEETNPYEARLGWITKLDKEYFIGIQALRTIKECKAKRVLVGFVLESRGIPRAGYPLLSDKGETIGVVTSGSQSPVLQQGIGLGYVHNKEAYRQPGRQITVNVRGRHLPARIVKPPFHKS